jgi:hypothetical protein
VSSRLKKGASPAERELYRAGTETLWTIALQLMEAEADHTLTCTEEHCDGRIYPWLHANMRDRDHAIMMCAVVMERMADMMSGLTVMLAEAPAEAQDR